MTETTTEPAPRIVDAAEALGLQIGARIQTSDEDGALRPGSHPLTRLDGAAWRSEAAAITLADHHLSGWFVVLDEPRTPRLARDVALDLRNAERNADNDGVTVRQVMAALSGVNPDAVFVIARDEEGNGFSPLAQLALALYDAECDYSGEIYPLDPEVDADPTLSQEDDGAPDGAFPVIVLWPTN